LLLRRLANCSTVGVVSEIGSQVRLWRRACMTKPVRDALGGYGWLGVHTAVRHNIPAVSGVRSQAGQDLGRIWPSRLRRHAPGGEAASQFRLSEVLDSARSRYMLAR
jgi:hypothetical protein